jgi:hypothetical protein
MLVNGKEVDMKTGGNPRDQATSFLITAAEAGNLEEVRALLKSEASNVLGALKVAERAKSQPESASKPYDLVIEVLFQAALKVAQEKNGSEMQRELEKTESWKKYSLEAKSTQEDKVRPSRPLNLEGLKVQTVEVAYAPQPKRGKKVELKPQRAVEEFAPVRQTVREVTMPAKSAVDQKSATAIEKNMVKKKKF